MDGNDGTFFWAGMDRKACSLLLGARELLGCFYFLILVRGGGRPSTTQRTLTKLQPDCHCPALT